MFILGIVFIYSIQCCVSQTFPQEITQIRTIPIKVHDHSSNEVIDRSLSVNIFENDINSVTASFCEENDVQVAFCYMLHDHVWKFIVNEREEYEKSVAVSQNDGMAFALPNAHLERYPPAVNAEYSRVFHPEMFVDFSEIISREEYVVQKVKHRWVEQQVRKVGFIHSCQLGDQGDTRILEDILGQMRAFGLEDVLDTIVVLNYGFAIDQSVQDRFSSKVEWVQVHEAIHYFEVPTLRIIHSLAKHLVLAQPDVDTQLLYLHTKGVSYRAVHPQVEDWRHMMMHFLIERHTTCLHLLQSGEIDCVGTNYRTLPHHMFSGNFWWATGSYLAARPEQRYEESAKYEAEIWLLHNSHARIFVLHSSNIDHAVLPYPRACYAAGDNSLELSTGSEQCGGPRTMRELRKYWQLF